MRCLLGLGLGLLALPLAAHPPTATSPSCAAASLTNGWCQACQVGFIGGVEIKWKLLYEALDPHGHDVDLAAIQCATCRRAVQSDGYCDVHRTGFVNGYLFASTLTYRLARGKARDVAKITCATCKANARRHRRKGPDTGGWCETCDIGLVGNVAFKDREDFKHASAEFEKLRKALKIAERCELCAAALVYDARCPKCRIVYKDGKAVGAGTKASAAADKLRHEGAKGEEATAATNGEQETTQPEGDERPGE